MSDYLFYSIFMIITGACIGSFLNVVALRALSNESIVLPSSKCPKCNSPIKWYDNIPVISYFLIFKGKCRNCKEKVSLQYPLVEAMTALIYWSVFSCFGFTLKTLLLLILLSISIVITITDIKEETVFDSHCWIFIITAIIYSIIENNIYFALTGFLFSAIIMELIAKGSYYLIKKDKQEENNSTVNEYVNKYKRAFAEGDTYLAAGAGALLGIKYFIAAVASAVIFQAVCILPSFLINLYKQKETKLLIYISTFIIFAAIYFILSNVFTLNLIITLGFIIILIFTAIKTITGLKQTVNEKGFNSVPFGPALLFSSFLMLFFGKYITAFIKQIIF